MKKSYNHLACALIVALVVLASVLTCGLSFFAVQLQRKDSDSISTSVAQTVVAFNLQCQPTPLSNADLTATAVALNPQSQASATPTSTPTPHQYVTVTPTATPYPCNNSATMVSETYPDHTQLDINQYFNKSWRLKNVGTCTWSTGYRLAFYSGNSMSAPYYVNMPYAVPPGGIVDIVVPMRAPGTAGVYTGYWGLYTNPNVLLFKKVWVTIDVAAPPDNCGDGVIDPGEACDGTTLPAGVPAGTACNACVLGPYCGDLIKNGSEECDGSDGVPVGATCSATCTINPYCGDGVIDLGEVCDAGLLNSDTAADACRTDCTPAGCGDGVIDTGEQCDGTTLPAGVPAGTACNACVLGPYCGDGVIDLGEVCDDGLLNSDTVPGACRTDCTPADCGDGVIDPGEVCDDGLLNSDIVPGACRTDCTPADCGDGVIDPGEQCDGTTLPAGVPAGTACNACVLGPYCGDLIKNGSEECDGSDGVPVGATCSATCTINPYCGDGVIDPGEVCDDGLLNSDTVPGACHTDCMSYDFWVTNVSLTVDPPTVEVPCWVPTNVTFIISADITTSAAGTITYHWRKGEGTMYQEFDPVELVYTEAGTQTVTLTWELTGVDIGGGEEWNLWAQIHIDSPNNQYFPRIDFNITHGSCLG